MATNEENTTRLSRFAESEEVKVTDGCGLPAQARYRTQTLNSTDETRMSLDNDFANPACLRSPYLLGMCTRTS